MKKNIKNIIIFIIIISIFYSITTFILDSNTHCLYRNLYGLPCPGCGLSRAYTALFEGNIRLAFYYHPLLILPPILILIILLRKFGIFKNLYRSSKFWVIICLLFFIVYIIRMILYFPNIEPMKFYEDGMFPKLIKLLFNKMKTFL